MLTLYEGRLAQIRLFSVIVWIFIMLRKFLKKIILRQNYFNTIQKFNCSLGKAICTVVCRSYPCSMIERLFSINFRHSSLQEFSILFLGWLDLLVESRWCSPLEQPKLACAVWHGMKYINYPNLLEVYFWINKSLY